MCWHLGRRWSLCPFIASAPSAALPHDGLSHVGPDRVYVKPSFSRPHGGASVTGCLEMHLIAVPDGNIRSGKAAMLHTAARGACESRRARTSPNISSASVISGRSTKLQRNAAVSAQERRHINSSTVTPGSQSCSVTKLSISRGAPHRNSWRQQSRCSETLPTPSNTHAVGIKVTPRNSGTM